MRVLISFVMLFVGVVASANAQKGNDNAGQIMTVHYLKQGVGLVKIDTAYQSSNTTTKVDNTTSGQVMTIDSIRIAPGSMYKISTDTIRCGNNNQRPVPDTKPSAPMNSKP